MSSNERLYTRHTNPQEEDLDKIRKAEIAKEKRKRRNRKKEKQLKKKRIKKQMKDNSVERAFLEEDKRQQETYKKWIS